MNRIDIIDCHATTTLLVNVDDSVLGIMKWVILAGGENVANVVLKQTLMQV